MSILPEFGIYAITDCEHFSGGTVLRKTECLLANGISLLQYRNKNKHSPEYRSLAEQLLSLCRQYNCPLIINDDLALTRAIHADGIHLGKQDQPVDAARFELGRRRLIGCSCYHQMGAAVSAERQGADYITLGAFYPSPTKPGATGVTLSQLQKIRRAVSLPIVAIGGITPENGRAIVESGANMLAAVSGLYRAADTAQAVRQYRCLWE